MSGIDAEGAVASWEIRQICHTHRRYPARGVQPKVFGNSESATSNLPSSPPPVNLGKHGFFAREVEGRYREGNEEEEDDDEREKFKNET